MTAKKKTLIELMLDVGIDPEDFIGNYVVSDTALGNALSFYDDVPKFNYSEETWGLKNHVKSTPVLSLAKNWKRTIITKQQFIDAYNEKNKPVGKLDEMDLSAGFRERAMNNGVTNIAEGKKVEDIEPCNVARQRDYESVHDFVAVGFNSDRKAALEKAAQQIALEKFGKDWHENTGEQPFSDDVVIDVISAHDGYYEARRPVNDFALSEKLFDKLIIKKWRIHTGSAYECGDSTCNKQKTLDEAFCEPVSQLNVTVENNTPHAIRADLLDIDVNELKVKFEQANEPLYEVIGKTESFEEADKRADNYASLSNVLRRAYDQASSGKGQERHGQDLPFTKQPMQLIQDLCGEGFALGQAMKKMQESQRLPHDAAIRELLGAINYIAGAIIHKEKLQGSK